MDVAELTLATLHRLSPELNEDFAEQLEALVLDCKQRPGMPDKREIKITLKIWPDPEDVDDVLIQPVTTTKRPARTLLPVVARRTQRGQLQFDYNIESESDVE